MPHTCGKQLSLFLPMNCTTLVILPRPQSSENIVTLGGCDNMNKMLFGPRGSSEVIWSRTAQ